MIEKRITTKLLEDEKKQIEDITNYDISIIDEMARTKNDLDKFTFNHFNLLENNEKLLKLLEKIEEDIKERDNEEEEEDDESIEDFTF